MQSRIIVGRVGSTVVTLRNPAEFALGSGGEGSRTPVVPRLVQGCSRMSVHEGNGPVRISLDFRGCSYYRSYVASLTKRPTSQFWVACFNNRNGRRLAIHSRV